MWTFNTKKRENMYKEQIKVLDATIRDGGLINNHDFDHRLVREVYKAVSSAGVDYMEIGYRNSDKLFSPDEYDESYTYGQILIIPRGCIQKMTTIKKGLDI